MKVAIAGYGIEGHAAYRYFVQRGADITVLDDKSIQAPSGVSVRTGLEAFSDLNGFDIVIRSPIIRPDRIKTDGKVTSVTKEFFKRCPAPIIGVTGSKGKSTTSTLIYEMLREANRTAYLIGNIGIPALDILNKVQTGELVVYELSSFQLWDLDQSPHIAVVLMIEPEHQNVHASVDEYFTAKANIVAHQDSNDLVVYLAPNPLTSKIALLGDGQKIPYYEKPGAHIEAGWIVIGKHKIIHISEIVLRGRHNIGNVCAAVTAVWQIVQDKRAVASVLRKFGGLHHRLELVDDIDGVKYYNDSYATTPNAAIAALNAFDNSKVIILGGSNKNADFEDLAREISRLGDDIRGVILIGATGKRLQGALSAAHVSGKKLFRISGQPTMSKIVRKARSIALRGDVVLLSPSCAPFDMFATCEVRGEQFGAAVKA